MDIINGHCKLLGGLMEEMSALCAHIGLNVLHVDFQSNNLRLKGIFTLAVSYILVTLYSFWKVSGDFVATVFCLVTLGSYTQAMMKIYIFVVHRTRILELTSLFHDIYFRNQPRTHCKLILEKYIGFGTIAFKFFKGLYFAIGVLFIFSPIVTGLLLKERLLPFGLFLPYLDHRASPGFEITYFYISLLIILTLPGFTASDSYFLSNIFLGMGHLDMMVALLDDLNDLLIGGRPGSGGGGRTSVLKIEYKLREIIVEHQDHYKFMRLFEKIFSAHSFVMVGCASLVMVVCLFVLVQHFWAVGLFMIGMVLVQILFICVMGTVFETSCERFGLKLYLINWHLLSPKHRQHLRLVMQMAQTPPLNTMGGILPSNLNSFMLVIKQMYSILMMLLRFVE